ncbi:hypothetical protein BKA69DRAFT_1053973 [Paraphysoderma sedebokerense]|nr:hypothetical protein BKA69DRAFT_1053973 [Paraphysoderma sedebokerense]
MPTQKTKSDISTAKNRRRSKSFNGKNPLLVKHPVGKGKPTCYNLPPEGHAYGKKVERVEDETAAQVLMHWNVTQKSKHQIPAMDYASMNVEAAKKGITSPKDQYEFRKANPIRKKVIDHSDGKPTKPPRKLPSDTNPNFTYGKPTRPSTPVARLLSQSSKQKKLDEETKRPKGTEKAANEYRDNATKKVTPKKKKVPITEQDPKTLFKMKRFQDVPSKIVSRHPAEFWEKVQSERQNAGH